MALSFEQYLGDGTNKNFSVPFGYIAQSHVTVTVDGVSATFTWLSASTVQLATAPAMDAVVEVRRTTPNTTVLVDFSDGSTLTESDLDVATLQEFYLSQEAYDRAVNSITLGPDGTFDLLGKRLRNVATPVASEDAATKAYVDSTLPAQVAAATAQASAAASYASDAASSAAAAAASASAAAASDTNADISEAAAAASADAAAASAAAASASAATVGADFASTSDPAKGDALVGMKRVLTGATALTLHQWHEAQVFNVKEFGAVGDGANDDTNAIQAAINAARAAVLGTVFFPPGWFRITAFLNIPGNVNAVNSGITIRGSGKWTSRIKVDFANNDWVRIGATGTDRAWGVFVEDIGLVAGVTQTTGAGFRITNTTNVEFHRIYMGSPRQAFSIGDETSADDVIGVKIFDSHIEGGTASTGFIDLRSGGVIDISRNKFNGNGASGAQLISSATDKNWDGVTFTDNTAEQWHRLFSVTGAGLANVRVSGNICDRPLDYQFYLIPATGGNVKQWTVCNNTFLGNAADNTAICFYLSQQLGGLVADITITGNHFSDYGNQAIYVHDGVKSVAIIGNEFRDCGYVGIGSFLRIGQNTVAVVVGNIGRVFSRTGLVDYGIIWDAVGTGSRQASTNLFFGASAAQSGTP